MEIIIIIVFNGNKNKGIEILCVGLYIRKWMVFLILYFRSKCIIIVILFIVFRGFLVGWDFNIFYFSFCWYCDWFNFM